MLIYKLSIMIFPWNIETKLMIKLLLMLLLLLLNIESVLNVLALLLMKQELKNSDSRKCGNHQMEPSEIFLTEQFSENQFYVKTFQELYQTGKNQLLSEDTVSEISINVLILQLKNQEN